MTKRIYSLIWRNQRALSIRCLWLPILLALTACGGGSTVALSTVVPAMTSVETSLTTGVASASVADYLVAAKAQINQQSVEFAAIRQAVFGLDVNGAAGINTLTSIDWNPTHDSSTFTVLDQARNHAVLTSNWDYRPLTTGTPAILGVVGQAPNATARYAAFGGNPLGERGNVQMDQLMKNTIALLAPRSSSNNFKVVVAHLPSNTTYWFPHELKVSSWFGAQYPGVTVNGVAAAQNTEDKCDGNKLDTCLQGVDLLVIGREQGPSGVNSTSPDNYPSTYDSSTIMQAVVSAQARGVPVLYLHHYRDENDLATRLLGYFGLSSSNNYWAMSGLKSFGYSSTASVPLDTVDLLALLDRLDKNTFTSTWSGCTNFIGKTYCSQEDATFMTEFSTLMIKLRSRLRALDEKGLALFSKAGYQQEKLLILLGDKYRALVSYPMNKSSAGVSFYRAYFSDMTAYNNRSNNQVATNLGNFSNVFAPNTATITRDVASTAPLSGKRELMTGLYVMPGQTVKISRNDTSDVKVTVGLNMLRDTTRLFDTYDRPTMLSSPKIQLLAGAPLTITSPFGGPLFFFIEAATGAPVVSAQVSGVITHPMLDDVNDAAKVFAFKNEVATTPTNWVGLTTDELTIHSNLTNFKATLAAYNNDLPKLVSNINTYMVKDTYELAGFKSSKAGTFQLPSGVLTFCTNAAWDCTGNQHLRDVMQHVISDNYSLSGAGTSGNPYDQNWALDPLGWGETHEIGHNLQVDRLKIYGGQSGEVSNNIFPMHKQMVYNRDTATNSPILRGGTGAKAVFDLIKTALISNNPSAAMQASVWGDTAYAANNGLRISFYRQLVEYSRHYNSARFSDGWELFTLLYLLDRNMSASQTDWVNAKSGLGFSTYTTYPSSMDGNDFMLVAGSRIIGRDMRAVFDMWGVTYTAEASMQVIAYALPAADALLFPMSDVNRGAAQVGKPIKMTTAATYPMGY